MYKRDIGAAGGWGGGVSSEEGPIPTDILQLITNHLATTCPLDPIPSAVLQSLCLSKCSCYPLSSKKPSLDPSSVKNYCPVSILPFLSKALERAVLNQLSSFLQQHNLLDPHQSGFQSGHSTETALLALTDALATARASSLSSVLILLDRPAAFDMRSTTNSWLPPWLS